MKGEKYLFVVSGPSGTGKDTVVAKLLGSHPEIDKTVSATTRTMREGEVNGKNYHFLTKEQFETALAEGNIVEHTCYCENYYGTLRSEVERHMEQQIPVILVIEVEGAGNIKRMLQLIMDDFQEMMVVERVNLDKHIKAACSIVALYNLRNLLQLLYNLVKLLRLPQIESHIGTSFVTYLFWVNDEL